MKLANILLVEDNDSDAAFFRDFFESQRICNKMIHVVSYSDAWLRIQSGEKFRFPGGGYSHPWQRWAGADRANQGAARV